MSEHVFGSFLPLSSHTFAPRIGIWHRHLCPQEGCIFTPFPMTSNTQSFFWFMPLIVGLQSHIGWQMLKVWLRDYRTWCAHDTVLIDFPPPKKKKKAEIKKEKLGFWWDEIPHAFLSFQNKTEEAASHPGDHVSRFHRLCSRLTLSGF